MCATVSCRQRAQADVRAEARRGVRRFAPRVPGANHDDVEASNLDRHTCRCRTRRRYAASRSSGVRRPLISSSAARASLQVGEHEFLRQRPPSASAAAARARRAPRARARPARCAARWSSPDDRAADRRRAPPRSARAGRPEPAPGRRRHARTGASSDRPQRGRQIASCLRRKADASDLSASSRSSAAIDPRPADTRSTIRDTRLPRPRDAFALDRIVRVAQARGVDERHAQARRCRPPPSPDRASCPARRSRSPAPRRRAR